MLVISATGDEWGVAGMPGSFNAGSSQLGSDCSACQGKRGGPLDRIPVFWKLARVVMLGMLLLALLAACGEQAGALDKLFPSADALAGWTADGVVALFDSENLYDLVDGQADAYFVYEFERAAVQNYRNAEGATLRVTLWQLATPEDAFGLYTSTVFGAPVAIGNDGDAVSGRRIAFWQNRYFAELFAFPAIPDADLRDSARAVSLNLPTGGERPELLDLLPEQGLVARSILFFHQEISVQDRLWLGGENVLGLGPETGAVLAQYEIGTAQAQLLLAKYPSETAAGAGAAALSDAGVGGLAAADTRGDLLAAVFGEIDGPAAAKLLAEALDSQ
jgi:hypothetical protein